VGGPERRRAGGATARVRQQARGARLARGAAAQAEEERRGAGAPGEGERLGRPEQERAQAQRGGSGVARAGVEAGDAGARVEQHAASRHWNGAGARDPGDARARRWRRWRRRWSRTRASACAGTARPGVQD
jgi:hypothetical protein